MHLKKGIAFCCAAVLLISSAIGCSSKQTVTTQNASTEAISNTDEYGSVSDINDNEIGSAGNNSRKDNANMSGSETGSVELTGVYEVNGTSEKSESNDIKSSEGNKNAILVKNGGSLVLTNSTLEKSGNTSNTDESNFYALNSIFAAVGGSSAIISDTTLSSSSKGTNGIFASGTDSCITVNDVTVHTTGNFSRGLDATYGGTVIGRNLKIITEGKHSAPLATSRGKGTITVDTAALNSAGEGSPCIYSTGNITAANVTGTAIRSQCAVVEGKNSITLKNCDLTGTGENGIMLYQNTSGDTGQGTAVFTATDSRLTTTSQGAMFYITNTDAKINLINTTLSFPSGILVEAAGNHTTNWGKEGANGGNITLAGANQILTGDIICDNISTVSLLLTSKTTLTSTINSENDGDVTISLDFDSKWNVTADSYVTALIDSDSTLTNIISNGHTIYYDASNDGSKWLKGKTITLPDGGRLTPVT